MPQNRNKITGNTTEYDKKKIILILISIYI